MSLKLKYYAKKWFSSILFLVSGTMTLLLFMSLICKIDNSYTHENIKDEKTSQFPLSAEIRDLNGQLLDTKHLQNNGKPLIIILWSMYCSPCIKELNVITKEYNKLELDSVIRIIALNIDSKKSVSEIIKFVKTYNWPFEIYQDFNDLSFCKKLSSQSLNNNTEPIMPKGWSVNTNEYYRLIVPQTFVFNSKFEVIYKKLNYSNNDEIQLFNILKQLH